MITLAFANRCILFAICDTTHDDDGEHQNISIETSEPEPFQVLVFIEL